MTRFLLLLAPTALLLSCSPRAYYRTLETEGPQTPALSRTETEPTPAPVRPELPVQSEGKPSRSDAQETAAAPTPPPVPPAPSAVTLTSDSRADFEGRWKAAEEAFEEAVFSLKSTSPLFEGKTAFESEEEHRLRRWQATQAMRQLREDTFGPLMEEHHRWMTEGIAIPGAIAIDPADYDGEKEIWTFEMVAEWKGSTLSGKGEWSIDRQSAKAWSDLHESRIEGTCTVLWSSFGAPYVAGIEAGGRSWARSYPLRTGAMKTTQGWATTPNGLYGPASSTMQTQPWGTEAVEHPSLPTYERTGTLLCQGYGQSAVACKDMPSLGWSTGGNTKVADDLHLLLEGEEFSFSGWKEVHALDIIESGREVAISGGQHKEGGAYGYHVWACAVQDPITGAHTAIGNAGSRVDMSDIPLADCISLHPDGGLACVTSVGEYSTSVEGLYRWSALGGSAKKSADVPEWAHFNAPSPNGQYLTVYNRQGQVQVTTFESTPRNLATWNCDDHELLGAIPSSDGMHVLTFEVVEELPRQKMAQLRIRKTAGGKVMWSSPAFDMYGVKKTTPGHDLTPNYLKVHGRECTVVGAAQSQVGLFILPVNFGFE